jgi:hypothetical protein
MERCKDEWEFCTYSIKVVDERGSTEELSRSNDRWLSKRGEALNRGNSLIARERLIFLLQFLKGNR